MNTRFSPLQAKPSSPGHLGVREKEVFNSVVDELFESDQLYQIDLPLIQLYACYSVKCEDLVKQLDTLTVQHTNAKNKTNVVLAPEFRALRDSTELLMKLKKQLEVKPHNYRSKAEKNPLDDFLTR